MNSRNLAVPSVNENVENNSKSATTITLNFSLVLFNMQKKAAAYVKKQILAPYEKIVGRKGGKCHKKFF